MTTHRLPDDLRGLVAQLVREALHDAGATTAPQATSRAGHDARERVSVSVLDGGREWRPSGPAAGAARTRVETVRITGDRDLQAFVYRLLEMFENPKLRDDVRTGRLQFTLAGGVAAAASPGAVERVERGAVTERMVARAANNGTRLVLSPHAVLTPLAREKARALGVPIEKEQR